MIPFSEAPELAPYMDAPRQLPRGASGTEARLELRFERRGDRTVLADVYRQAPLLVQRALYWDEALPALPCVFIITTSGGIVQGDRYSIDIRLARGAEAHITTQAATKVHEMDANHATQRQTIVLEDDAYLEYLPDAVIPFRHARFVSQTRVSVAPTATLLYGEVLLPGRKHRPGGELFEYDLVSASVCAERPDGRELFTERLVIEPARQDVRRVGVMGGFDVLGNVVLLTSREHAEAILEQVPATVDLDERWAAGAARLPNDAGLVYKALGMESRVVRAKILEFWRVVRRRVRGVDVHQGFWWR